MFAGRQPMRNATKNESCVSGFPGKTPAPTPHPSGAPPSAPPKGALNVLFIGGRQMGWDVAGTPAHVALTSRAPCLCAAPPPLL
jgi:hypothetical protein